MLFSANRRFVPVTSVTGAFWPQCAAASGCLPVYKVSVDALYPRQHYLPDWLDNAGGHHYD
jgi:peroxiredoxin